MRMFQSLSSSERGQRYNVVTQNFVSGVPDFLAVRMVQEPKNKEYTNASPVVGYYSQIEPRSPCSTVTTVSHDCSCNHSWGARCRTTCTVLVIMNLASDLT